MTRKQVITALRRAIGDARQRQWCKTFGVNETVLSDVLRGDREPTEYLCGLVGVERVVERVVTYRKKETVR